MKVKKTPDINPGRTTKYVMVAVSLLAGAVLVALVSTAVGDARPTLLIIASVMAAVGLLMVVLIREGVYEPDKGLRSPSHEGLIGQSAEARGDNMIFVNGALWKAECDEPLEKGDPVEVVEITGLTLKVRKT